MQAGRVRSLAPLRSPEERVITPRAPPNQYICRSGHRKSLKFKGLYGTIKVPYKLMNFHVLGTGIRFVVWRPQASSLGAARKLRFRANVSSQLAVLLLLSKQAPRNRLRDCISSPKVWSCGWFVFMGPTGISSLSQDP